MAKYTKNPNTNIMGRYPDGYQKASQNAGSNKMVWFNRAPTTQDYSNWFIGATWIDMSTLPASDPDIYMLVSKENKIATWIKCGSGIKYLRGDNSIAVYPTNSGYIDLLGTANEIITTEDAGNNKITWSLGGHVATQYTTDDGNSATPSSKNLNVYGGTAGRNINTASVHGSDTLRVEMNNAITLGDLMPPIAAGNNALSCTTGDINVAAGNIKLPNTNGTATQGVIKFGSQCRIHDYGILSVYIGHDAGNTTNTASTGSVGIGHDVLQSLTSGGNNIAIGQYSLVNLSTGSFNLAVGTWSGQALISGDYNTFIGAREAGLTVTSGSYNTALGNSALRQITTGSRNISIQRNNDAITLADSDNIMIGTSGYAGSNHILAIGSHGAGDYQVNRAFIAGIRGITTGVADAIPVLIDSNHQLGTVSSSIRYKENVKDLGEESREIYNLNPVTFNYKTDETKTKQYGLIAEEVATHLPRLVVYDEEGNPETIKYHELPILLLNELIEEHKIVKNLRERVRILEEQVSMLLENLSKLE